MITTVYRQFAATAAWQPHALAIDSGGQQLTFGVLLEQVDRLAGHLHRIVGDQSLLAPRPTVAILSENSASYLITELACSRLGVQVACLNWRQSHKEPEHCLRLAKPLILLHSARFNERVAQLKRGYSDLETADLYATLRDALTEPPHAKPAASDSEAGLLVLYTSGTTGFPKAAVLSNRALIARMCGFHMDLGIQKGDAFIAWAPMFHMGGSEHSLSSLMRGSPVLVTDGFDVSTIADYLTAFQIGWLILMPAAMEPLIEEVRRRVLAIRGIRVVGSMPDLLPESLIRETMAVFSAPFLNSFGSTETGLPPASGGLMHATDERLDFSKRISGLCEAKLIDESGTPVAQHNVGEMAVRGPTLFSGYLDDNGGIRSPLADGWFRMGDLFYSDEYRGLHFCGRSKYLIKSGGENIYPAEIERVLLADPRIAEAIAVRQPDPKWGEIPVVFIALESETKDVRSKSTINETEFIDLCREHIARYKAPKAVYIIGLEEFPRSDTGKVQREKLESWLIDPHQRSALRRA